MFIFIKDSENRGEETRRNIWFSFLAIKTDFRSILNFPNLVKTGFLLRNKRTSPYHCREYPLSSALFLLHSLL